MAEENYDLRKRIEEINKNQDPMSKTIRLIEDLKTTNELEKRIINFLRETIPPIEEIKNIKDEETKKVVLRIYAETIEYDIKKQNYRNKQE